MNSRVILSLLLASVLADSSAAQEPPPRSTDPRIKIELFAENPQIVTPTGIDVDAAGRVWAIESNTHFPPKDYQGHSSDRVLVMSDADNDGKADQIVVFTDGLTHTMSVAVRPVWFETAVVPAAPRRAPAALSVYLATRREIRLFHDDDGDLKSDRSDPIVHLDTKGNYPHNGLAGFAFHPLGWLYFGFGENLGADYKIIGSDGTTLSGGGEGGNIYRCRPDGSKLEKIASGFWNPHANCCDAFGRLFSVDNDPDSRPPCRLLHIIPGGDYGYRFRNGRKGLHPFTAWNGEISGTLPMVAGTGEAPSGILAYESNGLPEEYIGNLLVTSWGDHRIDRFRLQPKGASFTSLAEPLIVGGENFRPVGIACAPDGSLYCTDWVLRDYNLHGRGRVWRISAVMAQKEGAVTSTQISAESMEKQGQWLSDNRLDVRRSAAQALAKSEEGRQKLREWITSTNRSERVRLEALWALARMNDIGVRSLQGANLFARGDSVTAAAAEIMQSPLVGWDRAPAELLTRDLLAERLSGRTKLLLDGFALVPLLRLQSVVHPAALSIDDPFLFAVYVDRLAQLAKPDVVAEQLNPGNRTSKKARLAAVLAARLQNPQAAEIAAVAVGDRDPDVRQLAVQWIAEEKMSGLRSRVEVILSLPSVTPELFLATLAALEMLDGTAPADFDKSPPGKYVLPLVKDDKRPAPVRAQALRLVPANDPNLDGPLLGSLLKSTDPALQRETVLTLQASPLPVAAGLLLSIAGDNDRDVELRCEALVGLAGAAQADALGGPVRSFLAEVITKGKPVYRREALRSIRGLPADDAALRNVVLETARNLKPGGGAAFPGADEQAEQAAFALAGAKVELPANVASLLPKRPENKEQWLGQLSRGRAVDPANGRRAFFHANGAGCFKCHTVNGRGGKVGPDLTRISETANRVQIIQSILEPSSEISPQYTTWAFETTEGKVVTGMIVHENEGKTIVGDAEGKTTELKTVDIVARVPQKTSVMPEKLYEKMTLQELRDVIAFLESLK
jgi:putative membrane-bound dehydrogenase-like protein